MEVTVTLQLLNGVGGKIGVCGGCSIYSILKINNLL
jgi:hypothetical protein